MYFPFGIHKREHRKPCELDIDAAIFVLPLLCNAQYVVRISQCRKYKIGHSLSHNTLLCIKEVTCHTPVVVHSVTVGSATVQHSVIFRESRAHLAKAALSSVSSLEWDLDLLKLLHARVRIPLPVIRKMPCVGVEY